MANSGEESELNMSNFIYRFRSAKALLDDNIENGGFQELEKQTIYFAEPHSLNDPMEGVTDAFWDGDKVLWDNLFRHYALALIWYAGQWIIFNSKEIDQAKVSAGLTELNLPSDEFRKIYYEFRDEFCAEIKSSELSIILGLRTVPLKRERLKSLLFLAHNTALKHLFRVFKKYKLYENEIPFKVNNDEALKITVLGWEDISRSPQPTDMPVSDLLELLASIQNNTSQQLELGMLSRANDYQSSKKIIALMAKFPSMYVDAFLRDLNFPPWRVACFSGSCVNSSMWGMYGDEHRGAALVFRTEKNNLGESFHVKGVVGSSPLGIPLKVHSVDYRNRPPSLDCFLEIGVLPLEQLKHCWMADKESGDVSARLQEIIEDHEAWVKKHWEKAYARAAWKHPDWKHEHEKRLIISSPFNTDPAPSGACQYSCRVV